jgi:hypothetical protein
VPSSLFDGNVNAKSPVALVETVVVPTGACDDPLWIVFDSAAVTGTQLAGSPFARCNLPMTVVCVKATAQA